MSFNNMSFNKTMRFFGLCVFFSLQLSAQNTPNTSFAHGYFSKPSNNGCAAFSGEKTAICFINDYFEGPEWGQTCKHEFIKLIIDKAPHIIVTNDALKSLISFRRDLIESLYAYDITHLHNECYVENGYLFYKYGQRDGKKVPLKNQYLLQYLTELFAFDENEWAVYDTGIDLFYMRHQSAPEQIGIATQRFTYIPDVTSINPSPTRNDWADKISLLFNPNEWNERAKLHDKKTFIFFCGHGSEEARYPGETEYACGMTSKNFAKIMKYFNTNLKFDMFGIITCYWPTERLFKLARKEMHCSSLNYSLFTPISIQTPVWIYLRPNLEDYNNIAGITQYQQAYPTFFQALKEIATKHKSDITTRMKEYLQSVDPVIATKQCEGDYQRPSIIYAGQSHIEYLD